MPQVIKWKEKCYHPSADLNKCYDLPSKTSESDMLQPNMKEEVKSQNAVFSPPWLSLDYKNAAHSTLRAETPRPAPCNSQEKPVLINLLLARHSASPWIPFALRHKEPKSRHQVSDYN